MSIEAKRERERESENLLVCSNLDDLNNKTIDAYAWWMYVWLSHVKSMCSLCELCFRHLKF
jgi:hypothetical protein